MASELTVVPVDSKEKMETFLHLPWKFNKDDPLWVPPILKEHRKILDKEKGPFFQHGEAEYFLAMRDGEPVGRISAHINTLHDDIYKDNLGFFGFFECENNQETADALFEAAAAWNREKGRATIRGPLSFGIYDEVGVLVEGREYLPAMLQVHNPAYYADLCTGWGMDKAIDWYALRITRYLLDEEVEKYKKLLEVITRRNKLHIVMPKPSKLLSYADEVLDLFNQSWSRNWGHIPFTKEQFRDILKEIRPILRSDMIRFAVTDENEIVGFIIIIPDLNPTFQKLNGKMNLWGMIRLFWNARFRPLRRLKVVLLGVKREYQGKRLHHALMLSAYTYLNKLKNIEQVDASLVVEDHKFFLDTLKQYNAERYKTWRIYDKAL